MSDGTVGAGKCSSCGAFIVWFRTATGKSMPVDPNPVDNGNLKLDDSGRLVVVKPGEGTHVSHFSTCPQAGQHRKARSA